MTQFPAYKTNQGDISDDGKIPENKIKAFFKF